MGAQLLSRAPLVGDIARAMFVINEDLVVADTELPTPADRHWKIGFVVVN
ncbi:hypothetical protein [Pseudomonas cichorii]|uniref:Uncharacterized protein n=1 Tax=Pseudomonas cichorii TaxID=36746 RepID=A0ABQ1DUP5_PSECI|nr:hypothetical protein [Pseudomonas cichorii]AHF65903.1 hypothetical protein PCH70_07500 [Pseudomonas cichorii JBC1]GFM94740.1 hypothetical protein PSCICP_47120 [Pseudomonas cichorii]